MKAGALDRTIVLQRATLAPNAMNEPVETWGTLATRRASYQPVSDGERSQAAEVAAVIDCRFQIRWSADVASLSPKDRLTFEGRVFDIRGVKEIGRRQGLEISARARAE